MLDATEYEVSARFAAGEVEDTLYLLGGRELLTVGLGADRARRLLGILGGGFTAADLGHEFSADAPAVRQLIDRLIERDVVVPAPGGPPDLRVALDEAERNGGDRLAIGEPLAPSAVARIGVVGDTVVPLLDAVLAEHDGVARAHPDDADLVIAIGRQEFLAEFNRDALATGQPWIPVPPFDGRFQRIGPVIVPGVSPCFECAALRWASTTSFPERHAALSARAEPVRSDTALDATMLGFAMRFAVRWLFGHDWLVASNLLVYEPKVFEAGAHPVFRVARCTACGPGLVAGRAYPWRA